MSNYSVGHQAEQEAAKYLKNEGYDILEINWKTPRCEVDIICRKKDTIYLVEVKYRSSSDQGSGLDYITPAKLQQMQLAATIWSLENNYDGDYELSAIEMANDFEVTEFIPTLT